MDFVYRFEYADKSAFEIMPDGRAFIVFKDGRREEKFGKITNRVSRWQPIATAPRDGTICDLWMTGGGRFTDQWWCDEDKTWCGLEESMFTHWIKAPVEGPEKP